MVYFETENIGSLVRAIRFALENGNNYGQKAYCKYINGYTTEKMVNNYYSLYHSLLG